MIGGDPSPREPSSTFTPAVIEDIQIKAELSRYRIRGFGSLRPRVWATFDDLTFIPGTLTRIPLEGYREACETRTVLGTRFASKPIELDIPLMVTGMSFGALSRPPRPLSARSAPRGYLHNHRRRWDARRRTERIARTLIYEVLPSRYGINIQHLRQADAIEITIGQGAKPGTGGLLLGSKVSDEIARIRDLPSGVDQRSPCRHPDFLGPDDLVIKIEELREATDHRVPIFVKMGARACSTMFDWPPRRVRTLSLSTAWKEARPPRPSCCRNIQGFPHWLPYARPGAALEDIGLFGKVQLVIAGGLRHGSDFAKALSLGADACYLGTALLIALDCNKPI